MKRLFILSITIIVISSMYDVNAQNNWKILRPNQRTGNLIRIETWTEAWPDVAGKLETRTVTAEVWTAAFQAELDAKGSLHIPVRKEPYYIDGPLVLKSGQKLSADPAAEIRLKPGSNTCMVRNEHVVTLNTKPVPADQPLDTDITIEGGIWTTLANVVSSNGNERGHSTKENPVFGTHGVILLQNVRRVSVKNITVRQSKPFAVQLANAHEFVVDGVTLDATKRCGVQVEGPSSDGVIRRIKGDAEDDFVALNAWDWKNYAPSYGPIERIVIEDVTGAPTGVPSHNSIRLLPGVKRFDDGTTLDCPIRDITLRRITDIRHFKIYDQPNLELGRDNDFSVGVGTVKNLRLEDLTFNRPGQIELHANTDGLTIHNVRVNHPITPDWRLLAIGPLSQTAKGGKDPAKWTEIFSPDLDCTVRNVSVSGVRLRDANTDVPIEQVVKVIEQKPNPDYPKTTPKGGTGKGIWSGFDKSQLFQSNEDETPPHPPHRPAALAPLAALHAAEKTSLHPPQYIGPPRVEHAVTNRAYTGVASMAVAPNGRLWATWYAAETPAEDHMNYVVLSTSGDDGATWNEVLTVDPDGSGPMRSFDPQLWVSPDGRLFFAWAQMVVARSNPELRVWCIETSEPGSANSTWTKPCRIADGVMMCKPLVLSSGEWVFPISKWAQHDHSAQMIISADSGKTWLLRGGCNVPKDVRQYDEHMIVERKDGSLWLLARTKYGIGESVSTDRGKTWTELKPSAVLHTTSRFFISRLMSGNLLLVKHGGFETLTSRSHLTAYISKDDGRTWIGGLMLDERQGVSYPDGQQTPDGLIRIIYDFDRTGPIRNVLMATFREEDALTGKNVSHAVRLRLLVSNATGGKEEVVSKNPVNANADGKPLRKTKTGTLTSESIMVQNQQAATEKYVNYPMGIIEFKTDGKHTISVNLVEGNPETSSLESIKIVPIK